MNIISNIVLTCPTSKAYDVLMLCNGAQMYRIQFQDATETLEGAEEMHRLANYRRLFNKRTNIFAADPSEANEQAYKMALARYAVAKEICSLTFGADIVANVIDVIDAREKAKN